MSEPFNIHAYVQRIGYDRSLAPTYETLREIHRCHVQRITFENINPLMRWDIPLDAASLQLKMVEGGRGGYCFEHNLLLMYALRTIGFKVTGLSARVLSGRPKDATPPRTHMLLHVSTGEGDFIADAGFGGMTLTEPIRFEANTVQQTSHERRRLVPVDGEFLMEANVRDEWRTLYRFSLQPQALSDYEVFNWYVSNNAGSHFTTGLTAARPTPNGRFTLRNNALAKHNLHGETERTTLTSGDQIRSALTDIFLLTLPEDTSLNETLHRLAQKEE